VFLVDQKITFAGEELFKGDACQGRPMVRRPSVPFGSAIRAVTMRDVAARILPFSAKVCHCRRFLYQQSSTHRLPAVQKQRPIFTVVFQTKNTSFCSDTPSKRGNYKSDSWIQYTTPGLAIPNNSLFTMMNGKKQETR
jgi:hypothetical protein